VGVSAEESHHQAARCLELAEKAPSAKLKGFLLAEAEAWTGLAQEQEWLERRTAERRALAQFPTIRAVVSACSNGRPNRPEDRRQRAGKP
jgi:hypothetical protein